MATNWALIGNGGVASASSYSPNNSGSGEYLPSFAFDGGRTGSYPPAYWWRSANGYLNDTHADDWVKSTFANPKTINRIVLVGVYDSAGFGGDPQPAPGPNDTGTLYLPKSFELQVDQGLGFVTVPGGSFTGNNKVIVDISFADISNVVAVRALIHTSQTSFYNTTPSYAQVMELEAWGPSDALPGGTNVLLASNGGVASASSYVAGYEPSYINDGDTSGAYFWNDNTNGVFPDWCMVTLPSLTVINQVDVWTVSAASGFIKDFVVEYNDGSAWHTIATVTGNTQTHRSFPFSSVGVTAIRVTVNDADRSDSNATQYYYSRIAELQAWSPIPDVTVAGRRYSRMPLGAIN